MRSVYGLLVFFLIVFSWDASAQLFKGGFLLGINASQVDGDTYSGYDRAGLMAGAFIYTPLTHMMDVQFEIKYIGKGAAKPSSATNTDQPQDKYRSNLHYMELPILVRYKTRSKLGIEAGLGFGYLFSYSEEDNYGTIADDRVAHFNKFELSSILGGTWNLTDNLKVDMRFSYSVLPILNPPGEAYSPYFLKRGAYNNLFSLGVYWRIGE